MAILPTFRVPDTLGEYPYTQRGTKMRKWDFFFRVQYPGCNLNVSCARSRHSPGTDLVLGNHVSAFAPAAIKIQVYAMEALNSV